MIRTAFRLGTLPLLACFFVWPGSTVWLPLWQWLTLLLLAPWAIGALLLSFRQLKGDPPQGVVPLWARRIAPYSWAVCLILVLSVVVTSWPLHFAFRRAQPELERIALATRQGKPLPMPHQVGSFEVLDASLDEWGVSLWLSNADGESPTQLINYNIVLSDQEKSTTTDPSDTIKLSRNWVYCEPSD